MFQLLSERQVPADGSCRQLHVGPWCISFVLQSPADCGTFSPGVVHRLAENLVANVLDVDAHSVRVATLLPSGRPLVTVANAARVPTVSVSHVHRLHGAALSLEAQVGIDILHPDDATSSLETFLSSGELAMLPKKSSFFRGCLWAAKEAAYKAARLDIGFQPLRVHILDFTAEGFRWAVSGPYDRVEGVGRLATVNRHIAAFATTPAAAPTTAANGRSPHHTERAA
jgi:hypothetical protein